ncbi:MAG: biotin/lipoyl-binding protein [Roseburia sp.]|nr:biotin/lipoyl-binding protein [Roseburia sp.]
MKSYTITVNGNVYDVTVEENGSAAPSSNAVPRAAAPAAAPKPAAASGNNASAGNVKIEAGAAGKVFKIESSVGASVKKGDAILVLEIMKMETPVVATCDGTVASINVNVGDMVEAGALLATLNN